MGGLLKRFISTVAKKEGKSWHEVVTKCQNSWNSSYVTPLDMPPPDKFDESNFDKVVEALYQKNPMQFHALYSVGPTLSEKQAEAIFKFKVGQRVLVSMRTVSKKIRNPISSKYYSELRHSSWSKGSVKARRFGFSSEKKGLLNMYTVKIKNGPHATLYEDEMKPDRI